MTTASPLVSVVMIFLNAGRYIEEAIDSVVAQTYPNWELTLVDDGSTDDSAAIALRYAAQHPGRIRYVQHPGGENRGMSASRNRGVADGGGQYISFLDSDDIWLPERLAHFVEVATQHPRAGMIYGPTLYWYSWAAARGMEPPVPGQEDFAGHLGMPTDVLIEPPAPMRQFLLSGGGNLPGICSLLIRRDAYEAVGGFEQSFRGLYEDQVFLSKITLHSPVVVIDEVLDYYRQHSESCCYRAIETGEYHPNEIHPSRGRYLAWLEEYCAQTGVQDPTIRTALRRQLRPYRYPVIGWTKRSLAACGAGARAVVRAIVPRSFYQKLKSLRRRLREARHSLRQHQSS